MSVTKSNVLYNQPKGYRGRIWSLENLLMWTARMILAMAFFFIFLYIGRVELNIYDNALILSIFVFFNYIISGIVAFFLSYLIVKYLFGQFLHRQVKPLMTMMKGKKRMKKFWIYIFTILFQTIFFVLTVNMIIADKIPMTDSLAFVLAWVGLWIISRICGRILYFIFYTW